MRTLVRTPVRTLANSPAHQPGELAAALLNPRAVALVGASADARKVAARAQRYLRRHGFRGPVFPVNPRHAEVFAESVEHSGWLDELRLPLKTFGYTNFKEIIKLIPLGIKSEIVGKRPPIFHKSIPGVEKVRRIFEKVENKQ